MKKIAGVALLSLAFVLPLGLCGLLVFASPGRDVYGVLMIATIVGICGYGAWQVGWGLLSASAPARLVGFNQRLHQWVGWAALALLLAAALEYGLRAKSVDVNRVQSQALAQVAADRWLSGPTASKGPVWIRSWQTESLPMLQASHPKLRFQAWDASQASPCDHRQFKPDGEDLGMCLTSEGEWVSLNTNLNVLWHVAEVYWRSNECTGATVFFRVFGEWRLVGYSGRRCWLAADVIDAAGPGLQAAPSK